MSNKLFLGATIFCALAYALRYTLPGTNTPVYFTLILFFVLPVAYWIWSKRGFVLLRSLKWQGIATVILLFFTLGIGLFVFFTYQKLVATYSYSDGTIVQMLTPFKVERFSGRFLEGSADGTWDGLIQNNGFDTVKSVLDEESRNNHWPFTKAKIFLSLLNMLTLLSAFAFSIVFYLGSKADNRFKEKKGLAPLLVEVRNLIIQDEFAAACKKLTESPALNDVELKMEIEALYADFASTQKLFLSNQISFAEFEISRNRQNAALLKLVF